MRMVDLIHKKREGESLTKEEIDFIIQGYTRDEIPDYQMAAFTMAVFYQGMSRREIADFTNAMVHSGETIDLSAIEGIKVDKHSTGGVGDKVSLIIIPLVAAVGVPVAKMSGRGLGHTGGTIDKLEAIEGFRVELSREEFINHVNKYKMAIAGQTANLAPADKKLYALRDVTATVDSIPLIASSVMSKKIAAGADAIVLDVKVGSGAFMKSLGEAKELAETMVEIGNSLNRKTIAIITDMSQPLGREIGNANEVREAIEVLRGQGAKDLTAVALSIASYMTILGGIYEDFDTAHEELVKVIQSGQAIEKLKQLVSIQGGNPEVIDHPEKLPQAKHHIEVKAWESGFVASIDAESVGTAAMLLGAGRQKKGDTIDHAAGITLYKKIGDEVNPDDTLCVLHTNLENYDQAVQLIKKAYTFSNKKPKPKDFILDVIA